MNADTEKRFVAFVRTIANDCTICLRRNDENCRTCRAAWANDLMKQFESENQTIDYSVAARCVRIIGILKSCDGPIPASMIRIDENCSRKMKNWLLTKMVRIGMIGRVRDGYLNRYEYFVKKETDNENHNPRTGKR